MTAIPSSAAAVASEPSKFSKMKLDLMQFGSVFKGMMEHAITGKPTESAYQSMISLYCRSGGWTNDFLHSLMKLRRPAYKLPRANGVLGHLSRADVAHAASRIAQDGYYIFPKRLPEDLCQRLLDLSMTVPCKIITEAGKSAELMKYDRANPQAVIYRLPEAASLANPDVQNLVSDHSIVAVAQEYLGCQPILDLVSMWWSTTASKVANSDAAQLYHFDMDRIKWLKFFFYLTDVTPETGPHCYIKGTNRSGVQPLSLLKRGYARIDDDEMAEHFGKESFLELCGPRGTIMAVDTRGFHKGKPLERDDRLILQFEFTDSLFGGLFDRPQVAAEQTAQLADMMAHFPRIYGKYQFSGKAASTTA